MRYEKCAYDGYDVKVMETMGSTEVERICTNHWCPNRPGPCPKCGSKSDHLVAGMGMKEAACLDCGHAWIPSMARDGHGVAK